MEETKDLKENEINEEIIEDNETKIEIKEGKFSKIKRGFKKYGKKIAVAAAVGAAGIIGYALGSREEYQYEEIDLGDISSEDPISIESSDSKTDETEI